MHESTCSHNAVETGLHLALFYRDDDEYLDGVLSFINAGLDLDEPVAVAVPKPRAGLLRRHLRDSSGKVEILDMFELGLNPARIIPAVHTMLEKHGGQRLHYVGEPIWPGRSQEEIREATRHEALINLAWPGADIRVLCPYDASALDDYVLIAAERTHPWVIRDGRTQPSGAYSGATVPKDCDLPLPDPPGDAAELRFDLDDLPQVREFVTEHATAAGLRGERCSDIVLAVNEIATNTIRHAHSPGVLRAWTRPGRAIFQVEDPGHIADPLAGRRRPTASVDGGLGLWMVNQLCELVEVRTDPRGTTVRLHMTVA